MNNIVKINSTNHVIRYVLAFSLLVANAHTTNNSKTPNMAAAMLPATLLVVVLKSTDHLLILVKPSIASSMLPPFFQIAVYCCISRSGFFKELLQSNNC